MVHRHVLLFYEVGKGGGGILIHEKEGIVLNQCWIMQRMNKNIKRSRWHLTKMILSLGAAYEHCTYWTYGLMTCTNNPRYDFTCYRWHFQWRCPSSTISERSLADCFPMFTYSIDKDSTECYVWKSTGMVLVIYLSTRTCMTAIFFI